MDDSTNYESYTLDELVIARKNVMTNGKQSRLQAIELAIYNKEHNIVTQTPVAPAKAVGEKASRVDRLWAAIFDGVIMFICMIPFSDFFAIDIATSLQSQILWGLYLYATYFLLNGYLLYHHGQTIGKWLMKIRIEDLKGDKASLRRIFFLRWLPLQICGYTPFVKGFLIIDTLFIFTKQRRCVHDYIAKTQVCYSAR